MQTTTNYGLKKPEETDFYNVQDFNDNMDILDEKVQECFQSVSNGKKLIASAITDKGVATASDATFAVMAENIENIETSPNLQAKTATLDTTKTSVILTPDSGYDGLSKATVSITTQSKSAALSTSAQTIKPDSGKVLSAVSIPAIEGTAAVGDVLAGKTFNSATAGIKKPGTMVNRKGATVDAIAVSQDDTYTYFKTPAGCYSAESMVRTENSNLIPISTVQVSDNNTTSYDSEVESYNLATSYIYTIKNAGILRIILPANDRGSITVKIGTNTYTAKSEKTLIVGIVKKGDIVETINNTNWYGVGVYVYH